MKDALVSIGTDRSLAEAVRSELLSWQLMGWMRLTVLILAAEGNRPMAFLKFVLLDVVLSAPNATQGHPAAHVETWRCRALFLPCIESYPNCLFGRCLYS